MIDDVKMQFDATMLMVLNLIIAVNMFAVSLSLRLSDFKQVAQNPKASAVGLMGQFVFLPFFSFLFTLVVPMHPSVALALIMVSCCPGGNLSNVFTFLSKGNLALSVSLTAIGFPIALLATPLNFAFYTSLHPQVSALASVVNIEPVQFMKSIGLNLVLPLVLGCAIGSYFTRFYNFVAPYTGRFALLSLFTLIVIVGKDNLDIIEAFGTQYMGHAVAHNAVVLLVGYLTARVFSLNKADTRAVTIEVGIQNCPLGMVLILVFMPNLGGAVITIAFWGAWQMLSTWMLATYWKNR